MKKVLVFALVAMLIMASCLTAIAAETTTTKYVKVDGVEKLFVETIVTDVTDDTMLTYLAYKDNGDGVIADTEIVYIDQKTFDGSTTFSYKTDVNNLTGVKVMFGSSAADATAKEENESARVRSFTVTYNGVSKEIKAPTLVADVPTVWPTDFVIPATHEVTAITLNGEAIADGIVSITDGAVSITDNAAITEDAVIAITSAEKEVVLPPTIEDNATKHASFVQEKEIEGEAVKVETMTVFGIADTDLETGWGGIIVSETDGDFKLADVNETTIINYPALHKGANGEFAVQLVNESGELELTTKPMFARVYVTNAGGTSYGAVIPFAAINE